MTVRDFVKEQLETDWADIDDLKDVWVITTQAEPAPFARTTVVISQQSYGKFPQAPLSHRTVGLTLEVVSHHVDKDTAAAELEKVVPAVLDYLDSRYQFGDAETFPWGNLTAYRIPITVIAKKEN